MEQIWEDCESKLKNCGQAHLKQMINALTTLGISVQYRPVRNGTLLDRLCKQRN